MDDEQPKHASEMSEKEWRELAEKTRLGWGIAPPKTRAAQGRHARDFSEQEWRRELDKMHTKGRNK